MNQTERNLCALLLSGQETEGGRGWGGEARPGTGRRIGQRGERMGAGSRKRGGGEERKEEMSIMTNYGNIFNNWWFRYNTFQGAESRREETRIESQLSAPRPPPPPLFRSAPSTHCPAPGPDQAKPSQCPSSRSPFLLALRPPKAASVILSLFPLPAPAAPSSLPLPSIPPQISSRLCLCLSAAAAPLRGSPSLLPGSFSGSKRNT